MENIASKKGWKTQSGFIWAVLGSVVGFANILSFSAQCYKNGGGAFLIPYFFAYLIMGVPLLLLEGLIGQKMGLPLVSAYGKSFSKVGKFIGWFAILGCLTIGAFYSVLTGYSLLYTYFAASMKIPADTGHFFKQTILHATGTLSDFGTFSWMVFVPTILISISVGWILTREISKGIEKICSFVMPLLGLFVIGFAIAASFLPGAFAGISQFLSADFSKLSSPALWRDVFGQLFFSLSLGLGIIIGYAQYNGKNIELKRSMIWVALGDFLISFVSGWVIFSCVGYMCHLTGTPFTEMIKSDSAFEIGFIIFPKILQTFSPYLQPMLGMIFFFCVFIAGITGVFSIVESVAGNFEREFKYSRKKAVWSAIGAMGFLSIFFCMGNGQNLIGALAPVVLGMNMILATLLEILVFFYFSNEIKNDAIWQTKNGKHNFLSISIKYAIPLILSAIFIGGFLEEYRKFDLSSSVRLSWFLAVALISFYFSRRKLSLVLVVDK